MSVYTVYVLAFCDWLSGSEPRWTTHTQDETELSGSGPVPQRCSGTVGEKTYSPGQNNRSAGQEGVISCTLPRWIVCTWVRVYISLLTYISVLYTKQCFSLCAGVPKNRRGDVWLLLSHQHRLRHRLPQRLHAPDIPYHDLLKQLTAQQHAILVDLGVKACEIKRNLNSIIPQK